MIELAQKSGVSGDPVIRQELARYVSQVRVNGWTMRRSGAAGGKLTGADGSIAKLTTARICQESGPLLPDRGARACWPAGSPRWRVTSRR